MKLGFGFLQVPKQEMKLKTAFRRVCSKCGRSWKVAHFQGNPIKALPIAPNNWICGACKKRKKRG